MNINGIEIKCAFKEIKPIENLILSPDNPNEHSDEQVLEIANQIKFQGMRHPIIVSNQSGFVRAGAGRIMALKLLGFKEVPVDFQDFENEAQEYAFMVADNEINRKSKTNYQMVSEKIKDLDLKQDDFDLSLFAVPDSELEKIIAEVNPTEVEMPTLESRDPDFQQVTFILSNEQKNFLDEAMEKAKKDEDCTDEINQNRNGNILAAILKRYIYG